MSTTSFDEVLKGVAAGGLASLKTNLGKAWDSLTPEERTACEELLTDIARVRLEEVAGKDVSGHLPILESVYLQWKSVVSGEAAEAFKAVAQDVVAIGGTLIVSVLRGVLRI